MNVLSKSLASLEVPILSPWRPSIMDLPDEMLERTLEYFGVGALKMMREMNRRLLAASRSCKTRYLKNWRFKVILARRIRQFTDQVEIIRGVEIGVLVGDSREADAGIELLALERPELESVVILSSQCTDTTLWRLIRHHPKIKEVRLCGSYITGKYLKHLDATRSSVVEILDLSRCERLTDDGLICLLSKTGGTLRVLNVGYTNISLADLDPNLESMTRSSSILEELNLVGCFNLTESGLISLLNITGKTLRVLNLSNTRVGLSALATLTTSLPGLEDVNLSGCKNLTDSGMIAFLSLCGATLKILDVHDTDVDLSQVHSLTSDLPLLSKLNLSGCEHLTEAGIIQFLKTISKNLEDLNLSRTLVSFAENVLLTISFPALENLNLRHCNNLTDAVITTFLSKSQTTLKILDVGGTRVSFSDIGALSPELPALVKLDLFLSEYMTDFSISLFLNKSGKTLQILNLLGTRASFSDLGSLTTTFPRLQKLKLSCCDNLKNSGIVSFLNQTGDTLRILCLIGTIVSLSDIMSLSISFSSLEELKLSHCDMTDAAIIAFLNKTGGSLKILNLSGTAVSFSGIRKLSTRLPVLEKLVLSDCRKLTSAGLIGFLERTSRVLEVDAEGSNVDQDVYDSVKAVFPHLNMFY